MATTIKELTIVLASQRSGSSVLCQDVAAVGGLGIPKEYFLRIIGKNKPQDPSEQHVMEAIERGRDPERAEAAAIKMMINQAPAIASYVRGSPVLLPSAKTTQEVIDWARNRFERVAIIALIRDNSLDQAISKAVANASQQWHLDSKTSMATELEMDFDHDSDAFQMEILKALPLFISQKKIIRKIVDDNADIAHLLHYDDVAARPDDLARTIVNHTRALGFASLGEASSRTLIKLLDGEQSKKIKSSFKAFMARHSDSFA